MVGLIDTDRYPIDLLGTPAGEAFVEACAQRFGDDGVLVLPGFLTSDAVAAIAAEATARLDAAFFCHSEHNVFLDDGVEHLAADDPRVRPLRTRVGSIANDLLDPAGPLQQLYDWPALTTFVGAVLGHEQFHRGEDPLGALSINVYGVGDMHEWHFDESPFSVTIMIQEAAHGGFFEYVTGLRSTDGMDLDGIRSILDGDESRVERLPFTAGSLSIFAGRNTLHRVTEVDGDVHRVVPVLTFDTTPGSVNSDAVRRLFWGRTS